MPYVNQYKREEIDSTNGVNSLISEIECAGDLNYTITKLCHEYTKKFGERYQTYNDLIGALEGAKLELYRRKIAPYEDIKIVENGDV